MTELIQRSATTLAKDIADQKVSPVDLMRETLSRIATVNPGLNAIVSLRDREALMGEARLAEAMPASGPLHGIPIAVKDLVAVKELRSTWGAPMLRDFVPESDDGLARRLRAAGAILIGKTNVPMFGLGSHTTNPIFGDTANPFDMRLTSGGSSGGAAVALATGMLSLADGSDMMGSLRNPAAWNNVYGFRPTVGLVPGEHRGAPITHRLSTHGPMARSLEDLELLLGVLSDGVFSPLAQRPARPPKVAWLADWGGSYPMEPGLLDQVATAVGKMELLGWRVEPLAPPISAVTLWESWTTLRSFMVAQDLAVHWRDPSARDGLNEQSKWEIERGLQLTGEQVERGARGLSDWRVVLDQLWSRFDLLALPSTQMWPFAKDLTWPRTIAGREMDSYHRWMECVVPASLAGLPALNLPAGFGPNGLPAGIQIMGKPGTDAQILAWAKAYEEAIGPRRIVDPVSG